LELDDVVMRLDFENDLSNEPDSGGAHPEWLYSWLAAMTF
jgi:hypothetical protein